MKCPSCGWTMKSEGTVDNNWRFYKCPKCKHESAKHIHDKSVK